MHDPSERCWSTHEKRRMLLGQILNQQRLQFQKRRSIGLLGFVILQHVCESGIDTVWHRRLQLVA